MLNEFANRLNPKTVKVIKVSAIALTAIAGVIVVGVVLNKMGLLQLTAAEEIAETAASAA